VKVVIIADPMTLDAPLLKQPLHFMPDQSAAPSWMTDTLAKIKAKIFKRTGLI
jgi:hypothetical protein